jgi:lipid II:glycine glycyltransferase (peptidoglycan interpeptide bridge formation enzyme)
LYLVKEASYSDWTENLQNCQKINMLQCWQFGDAKVEISRWKVVRFLVINQDGNSVALAQVLFMTLPIVGGIARMNRGPLLIKRSEKDQDNNHLHKIISALLREFIKRRWWLVQIAPEIQNSELAVKLLKNLGLKKLALTPYASGLIDLQKDEKKLLMDLKKKWRYSLRKGQDLVKVRAIVGNSEELKILLSRYKALQQDNGFIGISDPLIIFLANQEAKDWQFTLFIANQKESSDIEDFFGMLISIRHGDTSTYFIGTTSEDGRALQVNYVLLWHAILHAKDNGCKWFDIGGCDATTPKGIAHFKKGLQSDPYYMIGEWRGLMYPWKSITNKI